MSKPELLKRKWSEYMTRNVRMARESLAKAVRRRARKRAKARGQFFCPKAAKAARVAAFGDA
eukprot:7177491-Prymnesium_polylepis.1